MKIDALYTYVKKKLRKKKFHWIKNETDIKKQPPSSPKDILLHQVPDHPSILNT